MAPTSAAGNGLLEGLHADALALASGREVSQAVKDRVLGQVGLAVCSLSAGMLSASEIDAIAGRRADEAVSAHAAACPGRSVRSPAVDAAGGVPAPSYGPWRALAAVPPEWRWPLTIFSCVVFSVFGSRGMLPAAWQAFRGLFQ